MFSRVFLSIFLITTGLLAQSEIGSASLNGTVTDPTGASVGGSKVTARSTGTGLQRTTETTAAGVYNINRLPVGVYDVSVEMQGFKSLLRKGVELGVGAIVTLDLKLELGSVSDTISVTSEAPVVETSRTTSSTTVSQRAVADLPVNGRNFIDFTTLTPGVVKDPTRGGDLSFGGQRGPANSLLVDGADSNNTFFGQATGRTGFRPYAFSQDAVQEFQVNTNSYPAEVGRSGGGAINVITKSGSNDMHGSAFWFYRDKGMNANTFVNNRAGTARTPYHFNQFGGSIGGPIVRNKLFYFYNVDAQRNTSTQIVSPNIAPTGAALDALKQYLTPYPLKLDNTVYLMKVDYNATDRDRLSVRFNASAYNGLNFESNGLSSAAEHTGNNQVNTKNLATTYTRLLGSSAVWESRFNYVRDEQPGLANATGPEVAIDNGITFGKNNFSPRFTNAFTYQPTSNVSWVSGRHSFKAGMDMVFQRIENFFPGLFAGQYQFASYAAFLARTPRAFSQAFSGTTTTAPISRPNANEYGLFLQDTWRVSDRLTINLGLRYDYSTYNQPTTVNTNAGLAASGLQTNVIPQDGNNVAPRFGFAYRIGGGDRTILRGGYGIFYARVPAIMLSTAILNNAIDVRNFTLTTGLPTYPNILTTPPGPGVPANIYVFDPNFRSPLTQQYSLQLEKGLGRNYSVTVGYLGVNGTKLSRSRDINLFPVALTTGTLCPTNAVCTAAEGTAIRFWRHPGTGGPARPNAAFGRITLFESGGNSLYHAGFVQLQKRFSNSFQVLTSYTFSRVIDSAPDATSVVPNNSGDDSKVAQDTLAPNLDRGPGQADIRHRFVFSAVWDINYAKSMQSALARGILGNWQLSTISQLQGGRVFNVTASGDPGNDGNASNDRPPYLGRNTYRGPNLLTWDLRLSKDVPLGTERIRLRFIAEAFNLTNRANFNGIQVGQLIHAGGIFRPTTNFGFAQSNFDPRIMQLAIKLVF